MKDKIQFETFKDVSSYEISNLHRKSQAVLTAWFVSKSIG